MDTGKTRSKEDVHICLENARVVAQRSSQLCRACHGNVVDEAVASTCGKGRAPREAVQLSAMIEVAQNEFSSAGCWFRSRVASEHREGTSLDAILYSPSPFYISNHPFLFFFHSSSLFTRCLFDCYNWKLEELLLSKSMLYSFFTCLRSVFVVTINDRRHVRRHLPAHLCRTMYFSALHFLRSFSCCSFLQYLLPFVGHGTSCLVFQ